MNALRMTAPAMLLPERFRQLGSPGTSPNATPGLLKNYRNGLIRMSSDLSMTRRWFLKCSGVLAASSAAPDVLLSQNARPQQQLPAGPRFSRPENHYSCGKTVAVTTTSREASESALWALTEGGNAADAYLTATLTQTVVEHGLTSVAGGFSVKYFEAATGKISSIVGPLGPAEAEPYDFDRQSPVTQTGRAMPVPGFLSGMHAAHSQHGKLNWKTLFEPAIKFANEGFPVSPLLVSAAASKAALHAEGKALWMKRGRFLKPGEVLIQPALAKTLEAVANEGPACFYEGQFATNYVRRAASDNGRITMQDMAGWRKLARTGEDRLEGSYRGYQISSGGLITYALHLNEALDLKASGPAKSSPDSLYRQYRIMEEVFLSSRGYSKETHEQFVSPEFARKRSEFVLNSPMRKLTFDAIFNTCFLVVRDRDGNIAWGTHSINTPTAFGAGIMVDGVYAAHAMNRAHVSGSGGSAPGISTSFALFKNGQPFLIAGSPGFGFVHGPWQYSAGIVEWELSPIEAMNQPRFGLPRQDGNVHVESHYDDKVFGMLSQRMIPFSKGRPSPFTGLVGALVLDEDGTLHAVQDGRRDGYALSK